MTGSGRSPSPADGLPRDRRALLASGMLLAGAGLAGTIGLADTLPASARMPRPVPHVPPGISASLAPQLRGHVQVVVAMGAGTDSDRAVVRSWVRTSRGWVLLGRWPGFNGARGWSVGHVGYLRSPVGVYSLTNAAGFLPNPGTRLPYQHDPAYYGLVVNGVRTFGYVVGINFNHVVGTPPSDGRRPLGANRGGDIWLHVAHRSGTHGCVGIPEAGMRSVLRWLRPASRPVIVMGPRSMIGS